MTERKFYRTVVQIEILSEDPYVYKDLLDVHDDITDGECSGLVTDVVLNEECNGARMAELLTAQSSDPEFFRITPFGDDLESQS